MIHPWKYLREEVQLNHLHANCTSDMIIAPLKAAEFFSSGIINLCYYKASMKFMKTSWHINTRPEGMWKGNTSKYAWFQASISLSRACLEKNIYENVPNGDCWGNGEVFCLFFKCVISCCPWHDGKEENEEMWKAKHKTDNPSFLTLINIYTILISYNILLQWVCQLVHPSTHLEMVNLSTLCWNRTLQATNMQSVSMTRQRIDLVKSVTEQQFLTPAWIDLCWKFTGKSKQLFH